MVIIIVFISPQIIVIGIVLQLKKSQLLQNITFIKRQKKRIIYYKILKHTTILFCLVPGERPSLHELIKNNII